MIQGLSQAACFKHVVFPDSVGGYGRVVNLAPPRRADAEATPGAAPNGGPGPMTPEVESFLRWLLSRSGLSLSHYKPETMLRRLPACLRALRAASPGQARSLLHHNPQLLWQALGTLLIGVTGFFRDEAVFDALRRRLLPDLLRRRRARGRDDPLRVWSAGCSDGAELYSVAVLLAEAGELSPGAAELVGTDMRPEALERAAAGAFDAAAVKSVPADLLRTCFSFHSDQYHVDPALRRAARWRHADVLAAPEPGPWDLVLCRNVAIYLQPDAAGALWSSLASVLRPGGLLVLGKAERPNGPCGLLPVEPCVYRREGAP
jgi:chemotaxis methyl-accepting protein methylase